MNILITGASGFIGSRLIEMKNELFKEEDKLILLTSTNFPNEICVFHNDYKYSKDDFKKIGIETIDAVIHLGHYLEEKNGHRDVCRGNLSSINNTIHLIDNLPSIPKIFVYISSMAIYGNNREEMLNEESKAMPENPYGLSKLYTEMILHEWANENKVYLHILRLSHVYGKGDMRRYTIPIWLKASLNGERIKLFANPNEIRNCLYVDDCCRFIAKASRIEEPIEVINAVSTKNYSMLEIAEHCRVASDNVEKIVIEDGQKINSGLYFEEPHLRIQYLGDEKYDLFEGLREEYLFLKRLEGN